VTGPNPNPNVVIDLRNEETLNSFSYVCAVRPFRKLTEIRTGDPSDE